MRVYEAIDGLFPASPFLPHPPSLKARQVWFVLIKANPRECFEPSQVLKLSSLIVQTPVQGSLSFSEALCLFFTSFSKVTLFIASIRILQELLEKTEPLFFCSFWFHNSFRGFCSRWQSAVKKPVWFVLETLCNQRLPWCVKGTYSCFKPTNATQCKSGVLKLGCRWLLPLEYHRNQRFKTSSRACHLI